MNSPIHQRCLLPLLACLLAAAQQAQALDAFGDMANVGRLEDVRREASPISVGPHEFEPSIDYKLLGIVTPHVFGAGDVGYTDNLLRGDADAPGVRLEREPGGRVTGGARLDTEFSDHRLELDYRARVTEYWETGRYDTLEHQATGRLDLIWNHVELHGDVTWQRSAYPQEIQLRGIVETERFRARVWGEARFKLGLEGGLRLGGNFERIDYLEGQLDNLDRRGPGADGQVYVRINTKLRALVEVNWRVVNYDEGRTGTLSDYQLFQVMAGVDGVLTPKISASLKAGWAFQNVDLHPRVMGRRDREYNNYVAAMSLRYLIFPQTRIVVSYEHLVEPSNVSNYLSTDLVRAEVRQRLFDEKLTLKAFISYGRSHVLPGENLNRITTGAEVIWQIREWLSLAGAYEFIKLNSTFPNNDYAVHTVTASLGFGL